ncbi:hypothetical protein M409DRAFT_22573 [Zasmidium cellare ATCC 36951]|uniref:NAD-dependent epimerase/dehydratase domain-containing protein n=1 Tax=Zasmidium cellare ATCC 36951 TaxID=1080233 RepID=A0A6A6CMJ2_ZASCE|nr:uncharacterized protein M409DRAFT_22573 [Zasmidium cellare ATCC 36951]KAF2167142.1 hypothetical protein M409DRAFT_22573 [Zasmidium cellare ATCC 36951]
MKIFLTGATGYVGGEALYNLYHSGDSHDIAVLNRHAESDKSILEAFPKVRVVQGDLDDTELIENESKAADIVFHLASTKHLPSSQAISKGLSSRDKPSFWVQMSGASMFSVPDIEHKSYGEPPSEIINDVDDTEKIRKIITDNPARTVDHLVLSQDRVKTALIIGPLIYGTGRGPGNTRSIQAPEMARVTLQQGEGFRVGAGKSAWSNVHVQDLGLLAADLAKAAAEDRSGCWNHDGVYAVENGGLEFGELGELIAREAHAQGLIKSSKVTHVMSADEANKAMPAGAIFWATNAVTVATRARKQLNWEPLQPSLTETVEEVVEIEAKRLK